MNAIPQPVARFVIKQDRTEDGRAAGWYVEENGVPNAFYSTKRQAERSVALLTQLTEAWGA